MVTDTIADMLTRIRNATMVKHRLVRVPSTKMCLEITKILKEEGFIESFQNRPENHPNDLVLFLKYTGKTEESVISKLERVSKPGLRVYSSSKTLPKVLNNLGIAILSTSKGLMTNLKAKELGVGGEILCHIW